MYVRTYVCALNIGSMYQSIVVIHCRNSELFLFARGTCHVLILRIFVSRMGNCTY